MQFRLGSIPVRVHGSFFVMTVVIAATFDPRPHVIAIVVAVIAASILAHELGHALVGRVLGLSPAIDLYGMGGLTSWANGKPVSHGRRVLISAAGPAVGLLVWAAVKVAVALGFVPGNELGLVTLATVAEVNGYWSLFNLLPMLPLDGGNVTLHSLNAFTGGRGERAARIISLVVAVAVALAAFAKGTDYLVILILAVSFAFQNARFLRRVSDIEREAPLRRVLEKAVADLHAGDIRAALDGVHTILQQESATAELRIEALRVQAYAFAADGRWGQLLQNLEGGMLKLFSDDDLARFENAARSSGSREAADAIAALRNPGHAQPAGDFHAG